ncbi:hypothetical protein GCM10017767_19270 [Halomonas urumqiensis]|nr:hypothetical protein GCM10017767_19270 [Halomonas urumqiensis]
MLETGTHAKPRGNRAVQKQGAMPIKVALLTTVAVLKQETALKREGASQDHSSAGRVARWRGDISSSEGAESTPPEARARLSLGAWAPSGRSLPAWEGHGE